jgi:quercetin dioxygenase-like cupin family protein
MSFPRLADLGTGEWQEHARFPGIYLKGLLTSADNPLASVNVVRVPPGGKIGRHRHAQQFETIWVIRGERNPNLRSDGGLYQRWTNNCYPTRTGTCFAK